MKNIFKVFVITAGIILFYNVNSFALVDGAAWGGYSFNGQVEGNSSADPHGLQYGAKAHYNTGLIPMLVLGVGGYYQYTKVKFDILNSETDVKRQSAGIDANLIVDIPVFPIDPYVRGTFAIWDKYDNNVENFKAYGAGLGIEITFLPFMRVFGEYMFDKTDHDGYLKMNSVNLGLKVDF